MHDEFEQVLNRALSQRLCTLAHDLNNGLGIISGYCELMAERTEPDSECAKRLHLILDVVQKLAKRINGHECRVVGTASISSNDAHRNGREAKQNGSD